MRFISLALTVALLTSAASAAELPAPTVKIGVMLLADYTYVDEPQTVDANGNRVNQSSFNVTRAYINLIGTIGPRYSFRVTPDIAREAGTGSSLSGSQTFRLKFAYGQVNLDEWTTPGSYVKAGLVQTPYIEFIESVYRHRLQGPIFVDRESILFSADSGIAGRYAFPSDYGEVVGGIYNGEGFFRTEQNNEKSVQLRATVRPLPKHAFLKGLRLTGFVQSDSYVEDSDRDRYIGAVTFEHPRVNAGLEYLRADDRRSVTLPEASANGWSAWATPRLPHNFELVLRHDELEPDDTTDASKSRNIVGIAYWVPMPKGVSAAIMLDRDAVDYSGFAANPADETRYGVHALLSF